MSEKADLVRRLFAAVEARDAAAVLACYHPDVEIHEAASLPYGGVYRGHDGAQQHWQRVTAAWDPLKTPAQRGLAPVFIDGEGDAVAVVFRESAAAASGERLEAAEIGIYTVRDGLIVRSQMFHEDSAAVAGFLARAQLDPAAARR